MMLWTSEWISDLLSMTSELHLVYGGMKRFFSPMEWYGLMLGALGGLFSTLVMSAIEVIPWRR